MSREAPDFSGRRWLITGGSGFLAANLARSRPLDRNELHLATRTRGGWRLGNLEPSVRLHQIDLLDRCAVAALFAKVRPEVVVHTATWRGSGGGDGRCEAVAADVLATTHLIEAALAYPPERVVHLGSSLEYGHRNHPLHEELALLPASLSGATKAASSLLLRQAAWSDGLPVVIVRCFLVYGPWARPDSLVPTAIRAIRDGTPLKLTEAGYVRDLLYAEDAVEAILLAATSDLPPGEVINVGSGVQSSNEEIVETIAGIMGCRPRIEVGAFSPRSHDTRRWLAEVKRARQLLGWRATTSLESGLRRTVDWVLERDG